MSTISGTGIVSISQLSQTKRLLWNIMWFQNNILTCFGSIIEHEKERTGRAVVQGSGPGEYRTYCQNFLSQNWKKTFYLVIHHIFVLECVMKDIFKFCKAKCCSNLAYWKDSITNMLWYSFSTSGMQNYTLMKIGLVFCRIRGWVERENSVNSSSLQQLSQVSQQ